ncbi:hypothetical protein ykris0001_14770 [Yersinia kristensenii ATCC 33638]|nr:hypothetical protein ykris0001_14770 [Yersinia kristensenii ATCC 33638]
MFYSVGIVDVKKTGAGSGYLPEEKTLALPSIFSVLHACLYRKI